MKKSDTKVNRYKPTAVEKKLLEVLINPDDLGKLVQELRSLAKIGRIKYYDAMSKDGLVDLANETTMDLIKGKASDVPNATYKYALIEKDYQDRKTTLIITGVYADRQEFKYSGGVDIRKQYEEMSDEELEELVERYEKTNGS